MEIDPAEQFKHRTEIELTSYSTVKIPFQIKSFIILAVLRRSVYQVSEFKEPILASLRLQATQLL